MAVAISRGVTMDMEIVQCGNCEELKAGVHAAALGLFVVMGAYNIAAWLCRRERHLAINAVVYTMLTAWEQQHVMHHLAELQKPTAESAPLLAFPPSASSDLAA